MAPAPRQKYTRKKNRNTKRITDRAVVIARITRWKHSDISDASLYGYIQKLKEFKAFCESNEPAVLHTEMAAKKLQADLRKTCKSAFRSYRKVMLRVEKEVRKAHPRVDFKKEFKATNVVTNLENIKRADEYFELATAMVGKAKNGKYVAKTEQQYKSKPVGELSISTVRRRMSPYVVEL